MMVRNASNKAVIVDVLHLSVVRLAAAVHETMSPFMTEIKENLSAVKENLTRIEGQVNFLAETITNVSETVSRDLEEVKNQSKPQVVKESVLQGILPHINELQEKVNKSEGSIRGQVDEQTAGICTKLDTIQSLLISVNTSMSQELETRLQEHSTQTASAHQDIDSKLDSLDSSVSQEFSVVKTRIQEHSSQTASELAGLETSQQTIDSKLDSLDSKQDSLSMTVMTVNSELEHNVLTNVTKELKKTADFITEYVPPLHECGGTGGWRRVVYLDVTDPNTNCPSGWQLTSHSKRTCGKVSTSSLSCDSVFFPVSGGDYTSVCGSIRAYQYSRVDAFEAYHVGHVTTIEGAYVSGVSLTHGSPRQHIWTFAAAATETITNAEGCPCNGATVTIPPFVGGDYFCESGLDSGSPSGFYPDDPLWDGEGCSSSSSCCSFNNPPYFTKQLPSPTSDPIEARLCRWDSADDSPVELMELYVK